jgi:hypothetical protein
MQGVLVFASSAARAAAITSPQEGQYSYLKDTNSTEYYDGAAWIAAPIGDITGVTAGVGITGGGTSGTVTVTNDMATTITAAGDIVVGTGNGTYDNLPIGTTNQVLTADTTVSPYKVKWATLASGAPTFRGCLAKGNTQSIPNSTDTAIAFGNADVYDTDAYHDITTNNSRITIPTGLGGYYLFTGSITWANQNANSRTILLYKNGARYDGVFGYTYPGGGSTSYLNQIFSVVVSTVAGDYFQIFGNQASGGNLDVYGDNNLPGLRFGCALIGV